MYENCQEFWKNYKYCLKLIVVLDNYCVSHYIQFYSCVNVQSKGEDLTKSQNLA